MKQTVKKPMGRPRTFDIENALDQALTLFSAKGYEATSLDDLTQALKINRSSFYAAFGSKEDLFRQVLAQYRAKIMAFVTEVMKSKTARGAVQELLTKSIEVIACNSEARGCLIVKSSLCTALNESGIRRELVEELDILRTMLITRFEQAKEEGELPEEVDVDKLARYVCAVHKGINVEAINGASQEYLYGISEMVMQNWPR